MRDKYGVGVDPYCYPGTSTLRNLHDIRDPNRLAQVEAEFALERAEQFEPDLEVLDFSTLTQIHWWLFQDTYDWAGDLRTVDIAKGETRFCTASRILPESEKLVAQLNDVRWLQDYKESDLAVQLAHYYNEFNVLHPFRDGNGRAQRLFFEVMAAHIGYGISWDGVSVDLWLSANERGYLGDLAPMISIFNKALDLDPEQ